MPQPELAPTAEDIPSAPLRPGAQPAPHLFRLLECESPVFLPARSCLRGLERVTFGRRPERSAEVDGRTLALGLPDRFLSTAHASLRRTEAGWLLEDLGSKNGTLVGGVRIGQRLLADGDVFEAGRTLFLFRAALAPTLLESQLFGHKKGAFSGAADDAPGLLRASDRGTLFLDEIGELPLPAQAALLRALAEAAVLPVGGTSAVPVDLRVVCATNRELKSMVAAGTFRGELLARLQGLSLELPPLRERRIDLGLFVAALLRRHAKDARAVRLEPEAARALVRYPWPFNLRELDQALAAALLLAAGRPIGLAHLPEALREGPRPPAPPPLAPEEQELRARLVALLVEHGGNLSAVARVLGKGRTQIVRWVQRLAIDPAQPR
jgi:Sigma-54 interaction domain/FHA domain